jgi:deoxyribodipyrimidine photo-lyase
VSIRHLARQAYDLAQAGNEGSGVWLSELIWRDFYAQIMANFPHAMARSFKPEYDAIKWEHGPHAHKLFDAWCQGRTGYPLVDAAMMQLAKTGWMHNRSRMIVASVLTKNLGVDWRWGQEYFRAMLIDLDEASNNGGWQWGASVGADPKPIRIFNPYLQAANYDKKNVYQNKWLSKEYFDANIPPIIEHKDAREQALKRYGLSKDAGARDY